MYDTIVYVSKAFTYQTINNGARRSLTIRAIVKPVAIIPSSLRKESSGTLKTQNPYEKATSIIRLKLMIRYCPSNMEHMDYHRLGMA